MKKLVSFMIVSALCFSAYAVYGNVEVVNDGITGTNTFTIPEMEDEGFCFWFERDYCGNVTPFVKLSYKADERIDFIKLEVVTDKGVDVVPLYKAFGTVSHRGDLYEGRYNTFYEYGSQSILDAFRNGEPEIWLTDAEDRVMLSYDLDNTRNILEVFWSEAKYRGID